ncbi:hypothetical protein HBN65_17370 [Pseudomonas lundensis]|nr:hypothetical protein [Pseudomonas lundensis]
MTRRFEALSQGMLQLYLYVLNIFKTVPVTVCEYKMLFQNDKTRQRFPATGSVLQILGAGGKS